jgi:AcrR family transcriptional regulator
MGSGSAPNSPASVDTERKLAPSQARAHDTLELIVETTGRLLEEIGFERLSTNMICKRAGLTPPALYRYFPNKYAVLRELGERLMREQDEAVLDWIEQGGHLTSTVEAAVAANRAVNERVIEITRRFPGNIAILRALRAIPMLRKVRMASRDMVAGRLAEALGPVYPHVSKARMAVAARLSVEIGYATMEMVLEEPRGQAGEVLDQSARAVVAYFGQLT